MPLSVELPEILDAHFRARMDGVHTAIPARVTAYNASTQTVDAVPTVKVVTYDDNGARVDDTLPTIPQVPVCWPSGGGFFISFPIAIGDHVLLVFSEGATGDWRVSGNTSSPSDVTRHGLNGAFAIPCARPDAQALQDPNATGIVLGKDGANLQISIDGSAITLGKGATDYAALASKVDQAISAIQSKFDAHSHVLTITTSTGTGSGTAAPPASPIGPQGSVAASLVKVK